MKCIRGLLPPYFYLLLVGILVFCAPPVDPAQSLVLSRWRLAIANEKEYMIKSVPWEFPVEEGGADLQHNGYADLEAEFVIQKSAISNKTMVFYSDCLDDAAEIYLNGSFAGRAGRFPLNYPENLNQYQSNVWQAVLIPLPDSLFKAGSNYLRLRVFDYAGLGGFCFAQTPVIAPYNTVAARHAYRPYINDVVKTSFLALLIVLFIFFIRRSLLESRMHPALLLTEIRRLLALPAQSLLRNSKSTIAPPEMQLRLLLGALLCLCTAAYMQSEIHFRTNLVVSELFWIKFGPIVFFAGVFALLTLIQKEALELFLSSSIIYRLALQICAVLTHPLLALAFCLYLSVIPFQETWGSFTVTGLFYFLCVATFLFFISAAGLLKYSVKGREPDLRTQALKEGALRLVCIAGMIAANWLWHSRSPYIQFSFLLVSIFLILFVMTMLRFQTGHRLRLPLLDGPISLSDRLQQEFDLTDREAQIVIFFKAGHSRKEAPAELKIATGTLKNHMKSIYAKTIDRNGSGISNERDKLARLMVLVGQMDNEQDS